ncbi:MAG: hypothetical protein KTR17_09005 [Cellvibrionaceae bacterium]|nr:hypothetical protein [Cellvibrionaceae bacterium]
MNIIAFNEAEKIECGPKTTAKKALNASEAKNYATLGLTARPIKTSFMAKPSCSITGWSII